MSPFIPPTDKLSKYHQFCSLLDDMKGQYFRFLNEPGLHHIPFYYTDFFERFLNTDIPNLNYKDLVVSWYEESSATRIHINGLECSVSPSGKLPYGCRSVLHGMDSITKESNHASLEFLAFSQYMEISRLQLENYSLMQQVCYPPNAEAGK